ncbi:MAG: carbamoyltransferase C-terminal domain-containing protein, partial [Hyphomicrobiaceae bacterium]
VAECLTQAGLTAADVDVVALPRTGYPTEYFAATAFFPGFAPSRGTANLLSVTRRPWLRDPHKALDVNRFLEPFGLSDRPVFFYNHHAAHAYATLFHTDWTDGLIYTSDGGGDRVFYSARVLDGTRLTDVFGGEQASVAWRRPQVKNDSLGLLYYHVTDALGFKPLRHEGKVLGLAAFGRPLYAEEFRANYSLSGDGQIHGSQPIKAVARRLKALAAEAKREDLAASVQQVLEDVTLESLGSILARHPARNLGVSGGVFANVKLTQRIAARFPFREVFVYPAMSDQGEAAGGVLQYLAERDGMPAWLARRSRFANLYFGYDYMAQADSFFDAAGMSNVAAGNVAEAAARLVAEGKIVGTYMGRMEYGPRALGARSILAAATDRTINDTLNKRLDRTEFMPFAPVVRAERAQDVFELPDSLLYTACYMTVTCDVKPEWSDRIPAVVHVDGTARPQIVHRGHNPTYYDALACYERLTGIPVTINTSFNVHEEPIVNTPAEAAVALRDNRVDFVATDTAIWAKP